MGMVCIGIPENLNFALGKYKEENDPSENSQRHEKGGGENEFKANPGATVLTNTQSDVLLPCISGEWNAFLLSATKEENENESENENEEEKENEKEEEDEEVEGEYNE